LISSATPWPATLYSTRDRPEAGSGPVGCCPGTSGRSRVRAAKANATPYLTGRCACSKDAFRIRHAACTLGQTDLLASGTNRTGWRAMKVGVCARCRKKRGCRLRQPGTWVSECEAFETQDFTPSEPHEGCQVTELDKDRLGKHRRGRGRSPLTRRALQPGSAARPPTAP